MMQWPALISGLEGWTRTTVARFWPPLSRLSYIITIRSPGLGTRSLLTLIASACAFTASESALAGTDLQLDPVIPRTVSNYLPFGPLAPGFRGNYLPISLGVRSLSDTASFEVIGLA